MGRHVTLVEFGFVLSVIALVMEEVQVGDKGGSCARARRVWCQSRVVALAHEKHTHQGIAQSGVKGFAGL